MSEAPSGDNGSINYYINPERNYAPQPFDRRHQFVQSYIYELPFGRGKNLLTSGPGAWILGGWQVNGILTLMTGTPFNVTAPGASLNAPGNTNNPNINGELTKLKQIGTTAFWFDRSVFSAPAANTFGNVGRNAFYGPGLFNLDASLFKTFRMTERVGLEFRAESFSITNTAWFNNPNGDLASGNFGRVTGTIGDQGNGGARQIQLGLKLTF